MATMLQFALQLVFPRLFNLVPRVTFSPPQTVAELTANGVQSVQQAIVEQAQKLLELHTVREPIVAPTLLRG
jgi:hypothetical protein